MVDATNPFIPTRDRFYKENQRAAKLAKKRGYVEYILRFDLKNPNLHNEDTYKETWSHVSTYGQQRVWAILEACKEE